MSIEILGNTFSHNARKVTWALEEVGASYEHTAVDLMSGAQKKPDFLALNPNGRVPVLKDGDFVLYESNAILFYIADKHGKLLPGEAEGRAQVWQWLAWQAADLAATCLEPWMMKLYASMGQPFDEPAHAEKVAVAKQPLTVLNGHLEGRKHVVGDALTVADIAIAESIGLCDFAGIDLTPYPAVRAWFAPLSERAAFKKTRPPQG